MQSSCFYIVACCLVGYRVFGGMWKVVDAWIICMKEVFFTHASMPQLPPWKEHVHTVCASRSSLNEVVAAVGFD